MVDVPFRQIFDLELCNGMEKQLTVSIVRPSLYSCIQLQSSGWHIKKNKLSKKLTVKMSKNVTLLKETYVFNGSTYKVLHLVDY